MRKLLLISLMFLVFSCANKHLSNAVQPNTITDTIIKADSLRLTNACNTKLTDAIAKTALTDYFLPKKYYPEETISLDSILNTDIPEAPRCFNMFKLYKIRAKTGRCGIGIITYFKCACFENGNHVRPHMAIIVPNKTGKYSIVNEDFLPDHFDIDTVKSKNDTIYIYGTIIDRTQQTEPKPYRAKIAM